MHTVVCCAAQENRVCKWSEYIDRNNKVAIFTHLMSYPNGIKFTVELASTQGKPDFKFK